MRRMTIELVDRVAFGEDGGTDLDYLIIPHAWKLIARRDLPPRWWREIGTVCREVMDRHIAGLTSSPTVEGPRPVGGRLASHER